MTKEEIRIWFTVVECFIAFNATSIQQFTQFNNFIIHLSVNQPPQVVCILVSNMADDVRNIEIIQELNESCRSSTL